MLKQILTVCERHGFLRACTDDNKYTIDIVGTLLLQNLQNEWINSAVNNKEYSMFYSSDDYVNSFDSVKLLCGERVPFGIVDVTKVEQHNNDDSVNHFTNYFNNDSVNLRCNLFVPSSEARVHFHQWERQRRTWWRKFSPNPGRYFTKDESNGTNSIFAKYPWGDQLVETLSLLNNKATSQLSKEQLHCKSLQQGKAKTSAVQIVSHINLHSMYMNAICDAYEELHTPNSTSRIVLKFHRKIAPYKIALAIGAAPTGVVMADLKDLSKHLAKKLRHINIATLLLPTTMSAKSSLEQQMVQYDQLGVPYTIILNENSLKNGVVQLRSRDTTLKEQVHVTDIPNYIELLFKNY